MKETQDLTPAHLKRAIDHIQMRAELAELARAQKVEQAEIARQESFVGDDFWRGLEQESPGQWAAVSNGELLGVYKSRDEATQFAAGQHSGRVVLIRQIGAKPPTQFVTPVQVSQRRHDIAETQEALKKQGEYYDRRLREKLEKEAFGQWAVASNSELIGVYRTNPQAAEAAGPLLGKQVCLIRHIGYVVGLRGIGDELTHVPVRRQ